MIDAKQRAIISAIDQESGRPLVCAEPSPDALSATAAALGGSGKAGANAIEAALSNSESAASIGLRTQSIQLLRDAFYRICEAYLNDGLDEISFDILQRRYQNHMIAFLAVEQLTGVTRAAQTSLSTEAAASVASSLKTLTAERDKDRATLASLQSRLDALQTEEGAAKKKVAETEDPTAKAAAQADLETLTAKVATAQADKDAAQANLDATTAAVAGAAPDQADASTAALATLGAASTRASEAHLAAVASTVQTITLEAMSQNYSIHTCVETLRRPSKDNPPHPTFVTYCNRLMAVVAEGEKERIAALVHNIRHAANDPGKIYDAVTAALKGGRVTPEQALALINALRTAQNIPVTSIGPKSVAPGISSDVSVR